MKQVFTGIIIYILEIILPISAQMRDWTVLLLEFVDYPVFSASISPFKGPGIEFNHPMKGAVNIYREQWKTLQCDATRIFTPSQSLSALTFPCCSEAVHWKNVLQFWLCYIRKTVQLYVLDLIFSLTAVAQNKQTTQVMVYSKVIDVPGYQAGLNVIMGRYK